VTLHHLLRILGAALALGCYAVAGAADDTLGESSSREVLYCAGAAAPYTGCLAADLRSKADALAKPVAIYEYMRNNYDYSLYHGARSGAVNTFLGGRGDDVDLAATLVAMLRSQGTPARYVVGTVRLPATQVENWLAVENPDLAYSMLRNQGIQKVAIATDKSTIDFEHVWVEALVPYATYRGAGPKVIDCNVTPASCNWVPLDPSFKQRAQRVSGLDPYSALSFDYNSYYASLKNNDAVRRDKNPLEIYQEQVLAWLQTTAPGKTLQDIPDFTEIRAETDGLLPASLPYALMGTVRRYNSAADHDAAVPAAEPKKWLKSVTAQAMFGANITLGGATVSLVDAATQRFTFTFSSNPPNMAETFRLGGTQVGSGINLLGGTLIINGQTVTLNTPFTLVVSMDGAPAPDSAGTDETITASYNAIVGGYYLIASGGETSNWSQVHRAAQDLLAANQQYQIVFNPADPGANGQACDPTTGLNCTPYVAGNATSWSSTDATLLASPAALDALTGGLLYVAGSQYYAAYRDKVEKLDAINKIRTPISGFLGVVSTTYEAEYIDGTAFSILPGGLLIDMKGIHFAGSWRIDQPATLSDTQFDMVGHIGSSLEHETWQQLTGYDAISTVRGTQMALNGGATLVNPVKSATTDTVVTMYPAFGYANTAPSSFTRNVRTIFGQSYLTYAYSGTGSSGFYTLRPDVTGLAIGDPLASVWAISSSQGYDGSAANYLSTYNTLMAAQTKAAQVVTNIPLTVNSTDFSTRDVISASLSNSPGFVLSSPAYARVGAANSTTYNFYVNETSAPADGSYGITVNAVESNKDGGLVLNGTTTGWTPYSIVITSPAGFQVGSPTFAGSNWSFNLLRTTAADGIYTVAFQVNVVSGLSVGYYTYTAPNIQVLGGRIVYGTLSVPFTYTVHNNTDLTCNGTTYTNQTPTVLLGDLQGCWNSYVSANAGYFNFFTPTTALVYRAFPTTNDAQLTTQIACIRNLLDQQNLASVWLEYQIPSLLSVGPNFRFGVSLLKKHDALNSGHVYGETFGIVNDWTTSPNDSVLGTTCN
jgi:transglutaminase-like putative cysteine protease